MAISFSKLVRNGKQQKSRQSVTALIVVVL
jgi:hypothetical protein